MKYLLSNIKNVFPYLFLISIYFFFINLEARNDISIEGINSKTIGKDKALNNDYLNIKNRDIRLKIPVIPFQKE